MKKFNLFIFFLVLSIVTYCQNRVLSGTVSDLSSGDILTAAHISVYKVERDEILDQTITGKHGDFLFSGLPAENIRLIISYIGYKVFEKQISLINSDVTGISLSLERSPVPVGEVRVIALRQEMNLRDVSLPMTVVNVREIEKRTAITTSDILKNEAGLAISRDGIWATSLNIRGLTEQRIVMLIDGNRIETATDVTAGLAMIDVNDIERIEVIKGAASSLYGNGAMGGVINIITKDGYFSDNLYITGSLTGIFQTVNKMHTENASIGMGGRKWYFRTGGTYRDALNTMTPEGELLNSQFRDNNLSLKAAFKLRSNHELKINYQRFFAKDVGIPGGSAFSVTATATYPVELRDMISAGYSIKNPSKKIELLQIKYFHHYILRDVRLNVSPTVTITPSGYHSTNGTLLQTNWNLKKNQKLIAGIDIWQRFLATEREKIVFNTVKDSSGNIIRTDRTVRGELPIPDTRFTSGGIFLKDQFSLMNDRLEIGMGGRFDLINIRNDKAIDPLYLVVNDVRNDFPPIQRISFPAGNAVNLGWSTDLGFLFHANPDIDFTLTAAKSFRSPSLEERFKYIDLGTTVKIGDPKLKPEEGYFLDIGTKMWKDRFHLSANLFINSMQNLIIEIPGFAYYNYTGQPERTDTVRALINSNVDKALLYGFDFICNYNFYDGIILTASTSYVRGMDTEKDNDLPLIPPLSGRLGIRYQTNSLHGVELFINMAGKQNKVGLGENVTGGHAIYDLNIYSSSLKLGFTKMKIAGGIENITNRAYVNHLATNRGIIKYEPGRNFYIKLRFEI